MRDRNLRKNFFILTLAFVCVGIVMVYSSSVMYAHKYFHDSAYFLKRHLLYLLIGIIGGGLAMGFDYKRLQKLSKPIIIASFVLLVLVLIPHIGSEAGGARRWFRFAGFGFQPSEFAKLCIILYTADFIARKSKLKSNFVLQFMPLFIVLGMTMLLIIVQPDLGTCILLAAVFCIMLFYGGLPLFYIFSMIGLSIPVLYFAIFSVPYRRMRIISFLNPWADPQGSGFQLIQSQIALGSGGIFGVGLGQSRQKMFYLPAAHTDFIFSIIGEETGLVGNILFIILFILFILLARKIILSCRDYFGRLFALGLISMLALKAVINIAVCSGVMPTKGLPLPFISYGGTSLVVDLIAVGLILNISLRSAEQN